MKNRYNQDRYVDIFDKYDAELEEICKQINALNEQIKPLKKRRFDILQYFRVQCQRGNITEKQLEDRVNLLKSIK